MKNTNANAMKNHSHLNIYRKNIKIIDLMKW